MEGARGALPLLAFAVSRLWERRDREKKRLTRAAYEEVGGVAGALAQHAEATLDRIGNTREPIVREIFRNLVTSHGTRAVAEREELLSLFPERKPAEEALRELVDARLLTSYEVEGKDGEPSRHRVEVVHESLLKAWPRLVRWQAQDEEGSLLRDQLKQAAHLWEEKSHSPDLLWTGTAFQEYELWRGRYAGALTALEEDFARAMAEKARRRKRLVRAAAVAVVLVSTSVAIAIAVSRNLAVRARERAEGAARRAEASKLVALGKLGLEVDPTATLAYVRKSLELADTAEARRLALEALWRGPVASVLSLPESGECGFLAASPDGQWLACSSFGGTIHVLSADGTVDRVLSGNRDAARPRIVRFSDDSRRLATFASGDPETVVWSVDGQEIARIRPGGYPGAFVGDDLVLALEPRPDRQEWQFVARRIGSPEERLLARVEAGSAWHAVDPSRASVVYSRERALFVRPYGEGARPRAEVRLGEHGARVAGVSVHDATGWIVSSDEKREVRIWDATTLRLLRAVQGLDPGAFDGGPMLDPRGTRLAWRSVRERALALWDLAGPPDAEPLLIHKSEDMGWAVFLGKRPWLAAALGTKVATWPLEMPWPRVLRGESQLVGVVFTPDSRQIVACGLRAIRVYPAVPDAPPAHPIGPRSGSFMFYGIAMEPAGRHVLLAATAWGVFLAPLDGGEPQALLRVPPTESICPVALDVAGRWAVTAACYAPEVKDRLLHVIDRRTGATRAFPLPGARAEEAWSGGVQFLRFVADGRLITGGLDSSLRRWDPETGTSDVLSETPCIGMDTSADGRRFVVACQAGVPAAPATPGKAAAEPPGELFTYDVPAGGRRKIESHGRDVRSLAISPSGDLLATGDSTGVIRVGKADGSEPHWLVGSPGRVGALAFSPDGRWIASTSGNDIRLWPMPDLSKPPLHTLPREALVAKIGSLTNVRVVEDTAAPTGYRLDLAPFPGWKDVPTW